MFKDLLFPSLGISSSDEVSRQPGGTTPVGVNVRVCETLTGRLRGGSRPGLSRFINEKVNGTAKIQHLAVLVDPTVEAISSDSDCGPSNETAEDLYFDGDDDYVEPADDADCANIWDDNLYMDDPSDGERNRGRRIRRRGSGKRPKRNKYTRPRIRFVQQRSSAFASSASARTLEFNSDVTPSSLLLVAVLTYKTAYTASTTVSVSDSRGNAYAQAGSYCRNTDTSIQNGDSVSLWYAVNNLLNHGPNIVTVEPSEDVTVTMAILEYTGVLTNSPLSGSSSRYVESYTPVPSGFSLSSGSAFVNAVGNLGIGVLGANFAIFPPTLGFRRRTASESRYSWTAATSTKRRVNYNSRLYVFENIKPPPNINGYTAQTGTITQWSRNGMIAAVFHHAQ